MDPFVQTMIAQHIWETPEWEALKNDVSEVSKLHLRDLIQVLFSTSIHAQDPDRFTEFSVEYDGIWMDYSRQRLTPKVKADLLKLAEKAQVSEKLVGVCQFVDNRML